MNQSVFCDMHLSLSRTRWPRGKAPKLALDRSQLLSGKRYYWARLDGEVVWEGTAHCAKCARTAALDLLDPQNC